MALAGAWDAFFVRILAFVENNWVGIGDFYETMTNNVLNNLTGGHDNLSTNIKNWNID